MPIYDFHCKSCDKTFELIVSMSATPDCPDCGTAGMEKLPSLTAPAGKVAGFIAKSRAQAAKEGHFSNYSKSERPKIK